MDEPTGREILDTLLNFRDAVFAYFEQVPTRAEMNARFDQTDVRFSGIDGRFSGIEGRLDRVERRLTNLETRVDEGFAKLEARRRR